MITIQARNAHRALSHGLFVMDTYGQVRNSRNGPVKLAPFPVTTEYRKPMERVVFWPERDANPFYHFYEALWMLQGRNDIKSLSKYAKNVVNFSDDGETWHGAYGYRWRNGKDQLAIIAHKLITNPDDRRAVLQMWDAKIDLAREGKDVPCNLVAHFQVNVNGALDLVVFCRSNDIIWGTYGANAVHFSMLLEYMAGLIEKPIGTYYQVSSNWHAYLDTLSQCANIPRMDYDDPYSNGLVTPLAMLPSHRDSALLDRDINQLLAFADQDALSHQTFVGGTPWSRMAVQLLMAHEYYRTLSGEAKYMVAKETLQNFPDWESVDWLVAGYQWLERRHKKFLEKVN